MAYYAVLAAPGHFFFRAFRVGKVYSVITKHTGAARFLKQTCHNCHPPAYILITL